jgi:hypothetical protein
VSIDVAYRPTKEKGKRGRRRRRSESAAAIDPNRSQIRGWTKRKKIKFSLALCTSYNSYFNEFRETIHPFKNTTLEGGFNSSP